MVVIGRSPDVTGTEAVDRLVRSQSQVRRGLLALRVGPPRTDRANLTLLGLLALSASGFARHRARRKRSVARKIVGSCDHRLFASRPC